MDESGSVLDSTESDVFVGGIFQSELESAMWFGYLHIFPLLLLTLASLCPFYNWDIFWIRVLAILASRMAAIIWRRS